MSKIIKEIESSVLLDGSGYVSDKIEVIIGEFDSFHIKQGNDVIQMTKEQVYALLEIVNDH